MVKALLVSVNAVLFFKIAILATSVGIAGTTHLYSLSVGGTVLLRVYQFVPSLENLMVNISLVGAL